MQSTKVQSPCIGICKLKDRVCLGCGRTIKQITNWLKYTPAERKKIIKQLDISRK